MDEGAIRSNLNKLNQSRDKRHKRLAEFHQIEILYWYCHDRANPLSTKEQQRKRVAVKADFSSTTVWAQEKNIQRKLGIEEEDIRNLPEEICRILHELLAHLPRQKKTFTFPEGELDIVSETVEVPDFSQLIWPPQTLENLPEEAETPQEDMNPETGSEEKRDDEEQGGDSQHTEDDTSDNSNGEKPPPPPERQRWVNNVVRFFNETRGSLTEHWADRESRWFTVAGGAVIVLVVLLILWVGGIRALTTVGDEQTAAFSEEPAVNRETTQTAMSEQIATEASLRLIVSQTPTPNETQVFSTVDAAVNQTLTAVALANPSATSTPSNTPTNTPIPTETSTPTITPTPSETPTITPTPPLLVDDFEDGDSLLWSATIDNVWSVDQGLNSQYGLLCVRPGAMLYPDMGWIDYTIRADISFSTNGGAAGVIARRRNNYNFYLAELTGTEARIRSSNEISSQRTDLVVLSAVDYPAQPGVIYNVALKVRGIELTMYVNGTLVINILNSRHSTGVVGIRCGDNTIATFDNVLVENP